jgi:hypothetical protein
MQPHEMALGRAQDGDGRQALRDQLVVGTRQTNDVAAGGRVD